MNRGKHAMPKNIRKKVQKTVRKDLQSGEDTPVKPLERKFPKPEEMLATQPKKRAKIEKSHLLSMEKSMERKKAKKQKKISKRTDPKDAIVGSVPAHVHPEGKRWMKTLVKQNKVASKRIVRKINKRK